MNTLKIIGKLFYICFIQKLHKRYKNTGEDNIINLSARLFWIFNKHIKNQICFCCYGIMFLINYYSLLKSLLK